MEGNLSVACVDQATYDKLKVNNAVLFDQATYDKLLTEVPKYKQITPSVLSERLRINRFLARRAIKDLIERGLIRMVSIHSSQQIPKYRQITPSILSERLRCKFIIRMSLTIVLHLAKCHLIRTKICYKLAGLACMFSTSVLF